MKATAIKLQDTLKTISKATLVSSCLLYMTPMAYAKSGPMPGRDKAPDIDNPDDDQIQTKVQIAILLDTSSSMNGLIDQAKSQLWKVVNSFNKAEKNGKVPFVEVALYEYGNNRLNVTENYIRQIEPLTRDLDEISKELFSLNTGGGEEYCGAVITKATNDLKWDDNPNTYKVIFIAGNEPFTQGPVNAIAASKQAADKNIIVNTIHCGAELAGIQGEWKTGALTAGGNFAVINQDRAVAHIPSPQDSIILKLNKELNLTYIPYGAQGHKKALDQTTQDANAEEKSKEGAIVQRSIFKSTHNYWNGNWDLCDASKVKDFDWKKLDMTTLPKSLQSKTVEEIKAQVIANQQTRVQIQKKMKKANQDRELHIQKIRAAKKEEDKEQTLDQAIQNAVKSQAKKKGYIFK